MDHEKSHEETSRSYHAFVVKETMSITVGTGGLHTYDMFSKAPALEPSVHSIIPEGKEILVMRGDPVTVVGAHSYVACAVNDRRMYVRVADAGVIIHTRMCAIENEFKNEVRGMVHHGVAVRRLHELIDEVAVSTVQES